MNTRTEEAAPDPTPGETTEGASTPVALRAVRYPSADFPMAPTVEIAIPESWRPIGAVVLNEMRTRPDIAVAGPEVTGEVRPNIMVKIDQVPAGADTVPRSPAELLEALFSRQSTEDNAIGFEHRIHAADTDPQPYGVSRYQERLGDVVVRRLTCAVVVSGGPVIFLIVVQAALSPVDHGALTAIETAFASLRVSDPAVTASDRRSTDG